MWLVDEGIVCVSSNDVSVRLELRGANVRASRRDARELADLVELHARALWDAGVRDLRPRAVALHDDGGSWPLEAGRFEVSRDADAVRFSGAPSAVIELQLGAAVELIQVLRWLAAQT